MSDGGKALMELSLREDILLRITLDIMQAFIQNQLNARMTDNL